MPSDPAALLEQSREAAHVRPNDANASGPGHTPRPRNPSVEAAWNSYALSFKLWAEIADSSVYSGRDGYYAAEAAKTEATIQHRERRDEALFAYFEAFDRDQREAFGSEE